SEGAFTGARKGGAPGLFEQAHKGTIFLDEIGDAPLSFQVKLLRVLQEKQVRRIGSSQIIPVDVRVISATNVDLKALIHQGKFREDLYYRLKVLPIKLPPLRERKPDILVLASSFYREYCKSVEHLVSLSPQESPDEQLLPEELLADYSGCNHRQKANPAIREILLLIASANNGYKPIGRRSLANQLNIPESAMRHHIAFLEERQYVIVSRGRNGLVLTEKGKEFLYSSL
ncbi:MAG: putative sigma54 specific transcriptional regulator with sensor, partial [Anaerospora sp.]|nr:putative sigma54 specific transcriptional regulator with sensor [Anaerospora sp.]